MAIATSDLSFGVEFECLLPHAAFADGRLSRGNYSRGNSVQALNPSRFRNGYRHGVLAGKWVAKSDSSIQAADGYTACEIVSPVLCGPKGLGNVVAALTWLRAQGGRVNASCGTHVHVGWKPSNGSDDYFPLKNLGHLVNLSAKWEEALYSQTGSPRRKAGSYSRAINGSTNHMKVADVLRKPAALSQILAEIRTIGINDFRMRSLNLTPILRILGGSTDGKPTVEFRSFAGTLNTQKAIGHICFSLALVELALASKYKPTWSPRQLRSENDRYRRGGPGESALYRAFRRFQWVPSNADRMVGWMDPEDCRLSEALAVSVPGEITRQTVMHKLTQMARKFDGGQEESEAPSSSARVETMDEARARIHIEGHPARPVPAPAPAPAPAPEYAGFVVESYSGERPVPHSVTVALSGLDTSERVVYTYDAARDSYHCLNSIQAIAGRNVNLRIEREAMIRWIDSTRHVPLAYSTSRTETTELTALTVEYHSDGQNPDRVILRTPEDYSFTYLRDIETRTYRRQEQQSLDGAFRPLSIPPDYITEQAMRQVFDRYRAARGLAPAVGPIFRG